MQRRFYRGRADPGAKIGSRGLPVASLGKARSLWYSRKGTLLGIFEVSILHNLVHLAFGLAGLLLARTWSGARGFPIGGGVIYLLLWLYGLLIDFEKPINFMPVNNADNWLHFGLGAGMVLLGVLLSRRPALERGVDTRRTPPTGR